MKSMHRGAAVFIYSSVILLQLLSHCHLSATFLKSAVHLTEKLADGAQLTCRIDRLCFLHGSVLFRGCS